MPGTKKKPSLARTAAGGLVFDRQIRRAAVQAAPPVAKLGLSIGRRAARQQTRDGLGRVKPVTRSRLVPAVGAAALGAVAIVLVTDPSRRRRLQRLIVH